MVNFDEKLMKAQTGEELKDMKVWMFGEQVKIQAKKEELEQLSHELLEEKKLLERERNALKRKIEAEDKRFNDHELLMAKKLKIIQNAYQQIEVDRKLLECERLNFEHERSIYRKTNRTTSKVIHFDQSSLDGSIFFKGVDNQLELRKRYKELLKIYHPDNRCGDTQTLQKIQLEYEQIRKKYYEV